MHSPPEGTLASTIEADPGLTLQQRRLAASIAQLRAEREVLERQAAARAASAPAPTTSVKVTAPQPQRVAVAAESFSALSRRLGGSVGLAYAPLGIGQTATSIGDLLAGPAWSTMKVPVAIAAVKAAGDHPDAQTLGLIHAALTSSDNAAAMQLWARLGRPAAAAARTQSVLRAGGDTTTVVPSATSRPG